MNTIIEKIKENIVTLIVTTVITLITIFSDKVVENIEFGLNRADLRTSQYENLAKNISTYVFEAENVTEYYEYGWTSKSSLQSLTSGYNNAITTLRKEEYVIIGLLLRFWNQKDVARFKAIMATVRSIDYQIHLLNSEAELIMAGKKNRAEQSVTKPITDRLKDLNKQLQKQVSDFLRALI